MCKNATASAATLMTAIEPTLVNLLTITGIATTPDGQAAITAFDAAQKDLAGWTPGTSAATVIEAIDAFSAVFAVLPIPADAKALEAVISAGIVTVIGVLTANSPAPVAASDPMPPAAMQENLQTLHAHAVSAATEAKVTELIGYKPSLITKAKVMFGDHAAIAHQYDSEWNKAVAKSDPKYAGLKC